MDTQVMIFYASAGFGHEKAARGIEEAMRTSLDPAAVECLDTVKLAPGFFGDLYRQTYLLQIKYAPWLWGMFYYSFDVPWIYFFTRKIRRLLNSLTARKLETLLVEKNPETVIATHFLAVEVAAFLKIRGRIRSKIISVVTDYLPHYVWTAAGVDGYAVAVEETKDGLIRRGVPAERIRITGIPIESKFLKTNSKEELAAKFNLKTSVFTILLTSGGGGIGALVDIVDGLLELKKTMQVLVVCGTNKDLFERLSKRSEAWPSLKVFGFVNNMQELMEVSDIVIGKAGGLTITESFSKGKPVILFQSIPGQERRNAVCVERYGAGILAHGAPDVIKRIRGLLENPKEFDSLKAGARQLSRPFAAEDIVRWVKEGVRV